MAEARSGGRASTRRHRGMVLVLAGGLLVGCASSGSQPDLDFDSSHYRKLMEAQRARRFVPAPEPDQTPPREEKLRSGDRARRAGEPERALWRYLEAHRLDPKDPSARARIAYLHLDTEPERAQRIFEAILEEDPGSVGSRLGLGLAHLAQGRLEEARASLEFARQIAPDSPEVLSALGAVYDRLGRHGDAQLQLQRARQLRPGDPRIVNNLGVSYLLGDRFEEAERAFRDAILQDPRDPAPRNNLGLALGKLERYGEALEVFREVGSEQAAQNNLGYVYFLNGRIPEAMRHYERALLAEGDEDLTVLRNLEAARAALP